MCRHEVERPKIAFGDTSQSAHFWTAIHAVHANKVYGGQHGQHCEIICYDNSNPHGAFAFVVRTLKNIEKCVATGECHPNTVGSALLAPAL